MASQQAKLILTDIKEEELKKTVESIKNSVLIAEKADVSKTEDWQRLARQIEQGPGYLDILINNAGMNTLGYFYETPVRLFNKVTDVNFYGVVNGCREMQPLLERSERGMMVNIASIFSLITMPMQTPYHASKFAVRGFTEALRQDMKFQKKNIDVICVIPGGIRTNIAKYAETEDISTDAMAKQLDAIALTTPEKAAQVIEKGMRKIKPRVHIGADAKLVDWLCRLLPINYYRVSNSLLGVKNILR